MMVKSNNPRNYHMKIEFEPNWSLISKIKSFVEDFVFSSVKDHTFGEAVALAASELLENAVKYSLEEKIAIHMSFESMRSQAPVVTIKVFNFADRGKIRELLKIIEKVNSCTPKEAYENRIKEILAQEHDDKTSQLGLVRLRYESGASLSVQVLHQNYVIVSAKVQKFGKGDNFL